MLYRVLITIHSGVRWVLLALLLTVIVQAVRGWRGGGAREKKHRMLTAICVGVADLQLLLGLGLFFGVTDWFTMLLADPGNVMRTTGLRFFAVEHWSGMLFAIALLHIGSVRSKRADDDKLAWRRLSLWFIAALLVILVSVPWPFMPVARPLFRFG